MADPWLTFIGLGEDGLSGLSAASHEALAAAQRIIGGPRHLALVGAGARGQEWPVPFDTAPVLALRGHKTVVLASGDPFWFGAGGSIAADLAPGEWISHPAPSTFQLAANVLGWRLEHTTCRGLHAAPCARIRPDLHAGRRIIATLRDGAAPAQFAAWLVEQGFGASRLTVMECLSGPHQRIRTMTAQNFNLTEIAAPVSVGVLVQGQAGLPVTPGLPDSSFQSDGQMTKSPIRALTLAALAPRRGETLWDLGAGTGTISVEWCLAGGVAFAVEQKPDRAANIRANALTFGVDHRLTVREGTSLDTMHSLPLPNAVFVGGGADHTLLTALWAHLIPGTRIVINAVTLETEAHLVQWHHDKGGDLFRFDVARAAPLGPMRGWTADRPVTQWSVTK